MPKLMKNYRSCSRKLALRPLRRRNSFSRRTMFKSNFGQYSMSPRNKLLDLPDGVLEQVLSYISIYHYPRIRSACKRLREVIESYTLHQFRKALYLESCNNSNSFRSNILHALNHATEVYLNAGYGNIFCGLLITMLRTVPQNNYCPPVEQVSKLLFRFYKMVDKHCGRNSQESRLLYCMTLMKLLKRFQNFKIMYSKVLPLHWRISIEIFGPWIGNIWTSRSSESIQEGHMRILALLSELYVSDRMRSPYKFVWHDKDEIYVYGLGQGQTKRSPKSTFTFTVHGSRRIIQIFRRCFGDGEEETQPMIQFPKDQFSVHFEIASKEAVKWGCREKQRYEVCPIIDDDSDDSDEEEDSD